ncbi:MAG: right-handed parallel beta-helix repeat-containing protein [Bacteroidetes bacterium]|nr:right-handed parallel beta-helix repeat-containing protein [Bacteroidota bacterium]
MKIFNPTFQAVIILLIIFLADPSLAQDNKLHLKPGISRTFYVSNTGNDTRSGLSENEAWRSLKKVSEFKFKPGDIIQFRGGDLFRGNLLFNNEEGTDSDPILITSYGLGRAVLRADKGNCIAVLNKGGYIIENLEITGIFNPDKDYSKNFGKEYNGIAIFTYARKNSSGVTVRDCVIRNFKDNGITLGADRNTIFGYSNITAERNKIYDCGDIGIKLWGLKYQNILIKGNTIFNIKGIIPHDHGFSGNGISISNTYNASVEYNLIFNNGKYAGRSGGGIVTGESRNIIVRYNEIYGITARDVDGDAIDFDNGSDSCTAEYNYTHNNDGAGFLLSGESGNSGSDNNIIRFNISKNDGLRNNHYAIKIYSIVGADNNQIYNNTIISIADRKNVSGCFEISGPTSNTYVRNNIFYTVNSAVFINIDSSKQTNLVFNANSYFAADQKFIVKWNKNLYNSFEEYINKTGQEKLNGVVIGLNKNPMMKSPLIKKDTVNNPYRLDTLNSYKLLPGSPLINSGVKILNLFTEAEMDFYGNRLTPENPPDIGAFQN